MDNFLEVHSTTDGIKWKLWTYYFCSIRGSDIRELRYSLCTLKNSYRSFMERAAILCSLFVDNWLWTWSATRSLS